MSDRAANKLGIPGWSAWLYTGIDDGGVLVKGSVCPLITQGKNAGKPNYRKADRSTDRTVYLGPEECT